MHSSMATGRKKVEDVFGTDTAYRVEQKTRQHLTRHAR